MRFISVDVEIANADMASICSIGAAVFENGRLADEWYTLGSVLNRDSPERGYVIQVFPDLGGLDGEAGLLAERCGMAAN